MKDQLYFLYKDIIFYLKSSEKVYVYALSVQLFSYSYIYNEHVLKYKTCANQSKFKNDRYQTITKPIKKFISFQFEIVLSKKTVIYISLKYPSVKGILTYYYSNIHTFIKKLSILFPNGVGRQSVS